MHSSESPKFVKDSSGNRYDIIRGASAPDFPNQEHSSFYIALVRTIYYPNYGQNTGYYIIAFPIIEGIGGREMVQWDSGTLFGWTSISREAVETFDKRLKEGFSASLSRDVMNNMERLEPIYA